jgi:hypothetical protein
MNEEKSEYIPDKKQWHEPAFFLLSTKKTGEGYIEADYEDDRYFNPTGSP